MGILLGVMCVAWGPLLDQQAKAAAARQWSVMADWDVGAYWEPRNGSYHMQIRAAAPDSSSPWTAGWDKHANPRGHCQFDIKGGKLTIVVPGTDHPDPDNAPMLLRNVEGDWIVQVAVEGDFKAGEIGVYRRAGLVLVAGKKRWTLSQGNRFHPGGVTMMGGGLFDHGGWRTTWEYAEGGASPYCFGEADLGATPTYLRLERRGNKLLPAASRDGKKWVELVPLENNSLPAKVKVGVSAASGDPSRFEPQFDNFSLSSPRR